MSVFIRRALGVALLALVIPALSGCTPRALRVIIPDFESAAVEGVQVWRLDDATGQPVADGDLHFVGTIQQDSAELVEYEYVRYDGTHVRLFSVIQRDANDPDQVQLNLLYEPGSVGWYKVSTYNLVGDSPLSTAQTYVAY